MKEKDIKELVSLRVGPRRMECEISLADLLEAADPIYDKAMAAIDQALAQANLREEDIDLIILAGGSSQLPGIADKIEKKVGVTPRPIPKSLMMSIASGAAIHQKDVAKYPQAERNKTKSGYTIGIRVNENGRKANQIVFNYDQTLPCNTKVHLKVPEGDQYILELVRVDDSNDAITTPLRKRKAKIQDGQKDLEILFEMDRDKSLKATAYDPKNPRYLEELSVEHADHEENMEEVRNRLKIQVSESEGKVMQPFLGIDLGTTTCEAVLLTRADDQLQYLENSEYMVDYNKNCFPSVIYFDEDGTQQISNNQALDAMNNSAQSSRVASHFKVKDRDTVILKVDSHSYTVKELETLLLSNIWNHLKTQFPTYDWKQAVITVPAGYTADEVQEVIEAAHTAGIEEVSLINEPTSAFKYYEKIQNLDTSDIRNVMVFDFGGGTTDVSIIDIKQGKTMFEGTKILSDYSVKGQGSDIHCGGQDIDAALQEIICERLNLSGRALNSSVNNRIRREAEKVKVMLSDLYQESLDNE